MIFALDTNVISEPRKTRPHGAIPNWFASHPPEAYGIPSMVLYELQQGAELTRLQDEEKARELDVWIGSLITSLIILPFDGEVARETARLMRKQPSNLFGDAAIAATARVHGLTIATRNTRDFIRFKVPLVNPFSFRAA